MKIIGHRGAADLALENTLESIRAAKKAGVDAIEFDVQLTIDNKFILCHDKSLHRVSKQRIKVRKQTAAAILSVLLKNGERVATLEQALRTAGKTPVLIEAKGGGWAHPLARLLHTRATSTVTVIARDQEELATFHYLLPNIPVYLVQRFNPVDVFQTLQAARELGFTGIDLNFWLLNPLTYWLAKRYKLDIVVYAVNYRWIARFLHKMFPDISITTDRPHMLQSLRTPVIASSDSVTHPCP